MGSVVFRGDHGLLVLLPGLPERDLYAIAARLKQEFLGWQSRIGEVGTGIKMSLGYLTFGGDMDLERELERVHYKIHPEPA